ncbi:MAG: cytochrome c biogenesis protein CcsA [Phycisphaerales bacterium]|nr:cytochrome c biogenesis protein CcsA [Planctomycetota bacterium]MCH8508931.1 cytochrome c biogenesis protein CcsA [Phycisphaerales bacterium]
MIRTLFAPLASLRLTVLLLALSMVLIFVGTLAQVRVGVWEAVDTYFRSAIAWVDLQLLVPESLGRVPYSVPFPGGATIGLLLLLNLLAAHSVRFKLTKRRFGVMLLHAGLIVLLAGEFVTAVFADEGLMSINEGQTVRFVEDIRTAELAVIDPTDPDADRVITVPGVLLERAARTGKPVRHDSLPFEIEVTEWMPNARLLRATGNARPAADHGVGAEAFPEALPPVRGVDGAQTDAPAAVVRLIQNNRSLGTWLLWANLIDPQAVETADARYGLALRFRRTYKPYELTLLEFRHDRFVGTQIARNFSSRLRLVDPERGVDREVLIWMNNPLRYRGATFYQASYKPDESGTILQVVRNPGAVLPYAACILVAIGMLWHFGLGMTAFLRRRGERAARERASGTAPAPSPARRALPWAVGALGLLIAGSELARPVPSGQYDLRTFGLLPVSSGGRVKPMDTAARHALMVAGGRQSVRHEEGSVPAIEFLVGLMARPEAIADLPVVRVDHPDVLSLLDLTPEQGGRVSLNTIEPHWERIADQAHRAFDIDSKRRDAFQRAVVRLYISVDTLLANARMRDPYIVPPLREGEEWQSFHAAFLESGIARPEGHPTTPHGASNLEGIHPAVAYAIAMMTAYSESDPEAFNRAVGGYHALLRREMPATMRRMDLEVLFNRARLFAGTTAVYVLAFMLIIGSMFLRLRSDQGAGRGSLAPERMRVSAVGLLWAAFAVHTLAIAIRIYLQGRPPVTNLYSSAVFVGWAAVLLGLLLERWHPIGVAALGAAGVGFATLIVAHNLGSDGDTMQMMQAVLDSNFWLATHVITITLGYSATFLAGALGAAYILLGVFTRLLTKERAQTLTKMVYAVVCFALLLSFVGTVLGGIWADQSWGRFWGWDPKENGAALVVLLAAIILHARWAGIIRQRGIMALAVGGNIVTAWSWFGTNMLGIGLHSYGFMESAVFWLIAFVVSQLALIALALLPMAAWRSHAADPSHGVANQSQR